MRFRHTFSAVLSAVFELHATIYQGLHQDAGNCKIDLCDQHKHGEIYSSNLTVLSNVFIFLEDLILQMALFKLN